MCNVSWHRQRGSAYSSLASVRSLPRGSRTTSLPFVEFLSFLRASPFLLSSSSFICSISFFFYFCTLCLSLIRYLSFFLLFQLYVLKAVFIDFFCNFCQTPPARPATGSQAITSFAYEKLSSKCIHQTVCSSLRHFEKNIQRTQCCQLCYSAVFRRLFGKENREKI